ncbi:MAG: ATP-binding protein [Bryobacteraceae bacterium]
MSWLLFVLAIEREENQILSEHVRQAQSQVAAIEQQVAACLHFALALQALVEQDPEANRRVLRRFYEMLVQAKDSPHRPAVRLVEWLRQVPARELEAFERRQRVLRGDPGYFVWQPDTQDRRKRASGRPFYHVVEWIEPAEKHGWVPGLDSGHSPATQAAIWRARVTGRLTATAGFRLAQDPPGRTSVIVYAPVFAAGETARGELLGLAAIGVSVQPLLDAAMLPAARPGFEVRIYDEGVHGDERLLLAGRSVPAREEGAWRTVQTPPFERAIQVADRRWHIVCSGTYPLPFGRTWTAWLLLTASLLITAGVQFTIVSLHRQNVRIRKEVQLRTRQLRRALRLAREGMEAKSRFLAKISHEIRTPLNGILGTTHLLLEGGLTPEQRESAELILTAGRHLLAVVNDTLDLSKIEAGKLVLAHEPFPLRQLLRDCERIFRPVAEQKGLELAVQAAAELPEWVEGDVTRLRQVLWNLLSNAVKFTEQGRVELTAEPATTAPRVRFTVRDTGPGISKDDLTRLFEPYFQSTTPGKTAEGTGLGLAISRRLVELMGGEMGCESQLGAGSLFWFEAPLPAAAPAESRPAGGGPGRLPLRASVLLAEDNPINQMVSRKLLERLGCQVTLAANGAEALQAAQSRAFDLILMDCQMPVMDGYEAARRIRRLGGPMERTPILALTAHALEDERRRCLGCGMNDVLTKPVSFEALRQAIERALSPAQPQPPPEGGSSGGAVLLHSTRSDAAEPERSP